MAGKPGRKWTNGQGSLKGEIPYVVRRTSRRRSIGIQVLPDSRVVFRVPRRYSGDLNHLLEKHADWILRRQNHYKAHPPSNLLPPGIDTTKAMKQHRTQALQTIEESIRRFEPLVGVSPGKTTIRNQKTRWGSCNKHRHLNFNWRLVLLPPDLLDYVVVHEMCHMTHLNHSRQFWKQVESILPDYVKRRHLLKTRYSCLLYTE